MDESTFCKAVEQVFEHIIAVLESSDADLDFELSEGGILTLELPDGSKIILNRHVPNREIWLAARSGGFHFQARGEEPKDEEALGEVWQLWQDTRSGEALVHVLSRCLHEQGGELIRF